jgi:cytoskeletal protein RodZ
MALLKPIKSPFEPELQDPPSSEARSVGEKLRTQRLTLDIDLAGAAAALRIKPKYLVAIEEGRPDLLPGVTYALGFLRSYSEYLGLDSGDILRQMKLEVDPFDVKPGLSFPIPLSERGLPTRWTLTVAILFAACSYIAWYYVAEDQRIPGERIAAVPSELLPVKPESGEQTKPRGSVAAASSFPGRGIQVRPGSGSVVPIHNATSASTVGSALSGFGPLARGAGSPADAGASPPPSASARTAAPPTVVAVGDSPPSPAPVPVLPRAPSSELPNPVVQPPPQPAGSLNGGESPGGSDRDAPNPAAAFAASPPRSAIGGGEYPSRVTVRANIESWIQIRAADRSVLFVGVLKPGDIYRVPDRLGLTLRVGNAGGLDVIVDGKQAAALGPMGAVRNVSLDPQSLLGQGADRD